MEQLNLKELFNHQKECHIQQPYSDYAQRIKILKLLRKVVVNNKDKIITAINKDFGCRPAYETEVLEIFPSLESIDFAIKNLFNYMKPRKHETSKWFWPSKAYVFPVPKGVVGIISPWNYPLFLTIAPLVAAFSAGNRVMIKLSEYAPNISDVLYELLSTNFIDSKLVIVRGDAHLAAEFSSLPFDHLFFTGSSEIGKKVMAAASSNLTPVTLELGGKSPAILVPEEINQHYLNKIWTGKIMNAGQTCIAPDYIWLPRDKKTDLKYQSKIIEYSKIAVSKIIDDFLSKDYCSIANKSSYDRILSLIDKAVKQGAIWYPLASNNIWHSADNGVYKISPGLLLNANHTMQIMQEEIFGPVMPVMCYDNIKELLTIMQVVPRPLAMYLFTKNKDIREDFLKNTISGALSYNATVIHAAQESLPFGGAGQSGMGIYRGRYGFDTFSALRPVFKQSRLDIFSKFYPPRAGWQKMLLKFMIK